MKQEREKCSIHNINLSIDKCGYEYCLECARELRKSIEQTASYTIRKRKKPPSMERGQANASLKSYTHVR